MIDISTLVKSQFPEYVQAEGPNLIAFVEAYYQWYEQSDLIRSQQLLTLRDIDDTVDEFVTYFKSKYLKGLPKLSRGNIREFIKHSKDLYESKGTDKSIQLVLRLLYDIDSDVYSPGSDVLRASDGHWYIPVYLEVSPSVRNKSFIGTTITGGSSGATAIVESVVRRVSNGAYYDVLYLSSVRGDFQTNEYVTNDGLALNAPVVIGSLNEIVIVNGGKNNNIGDVFSIFSDNGKQGKVRVTGTENGTGRVDYTLIDGGTGYTMTADTITSEKMFRIDPAVGTGFVVYEQVSQKLANLSYLSGNGTFAVGDVVRGYTSGTWIEQANGIVITSTGSNTAGSIRIFVTSGDFRFADTYRNSGNTVGGLIANCTDITATANVVGSNSTYIGVTDIDRIFYVANGATSITGSYSNTVANLVSQSTGSGATFSVGSLENEESVFINQDFLNDYNSANVLFSEVYLDGSGSGVGFVDSVQIINGGTGYSNGASITFLGGGRTIVSITINAGGTGYSNGEHLTASGVGNGALISIITSGVGAITSFNIVDGGQYVSAPTLTVANTVGTGANLTAVISNPTVAVGTANTDGSGAITSVSLSSQGSGYFSKPILTVPGGTGANLNPIMDYGFGFPKNVHGDANNVINDLLSYATVTAGTISSLKNIAPGASYTVDPFVRVSEPYISGLDRRDFIIGISNTNGLFITGELVRQNIIDPGIQLTFTGITGNTGFDVGEQVTQNTAQGIVYYRDGTTVRLSEVTGTFINTANSITQIVGNVSDATANVANVQSISILNTAKGQIRSTNTTSMTIKRTTINTAFKIGSSIIGVRSTANAMIDSVNFDYSTEAMGNNAIVEAKVKTANGIATSLEVIDSGFGYLEAEDVELINPDNEFIISGLSVLINQGTGEGFWTSTDGFLNSDKHIHDGEYYQAFSYEIQTTLSLDRYSEVLKKIVHVAGTKIFGKVVLNPEIEFISDVVSSSILQE